MTFPFEFYNRNKDGSARWAQPADIKPLLGGPGAFVGYWGREMLTYGQDGPWLELGGAGSGKFTTLIAHILCGLNWRRPPPMLALDVKGELGAVTIAVQEALGRDPRALNPAGIFSGLLPQDRCNPVDILTPESPTLHADSGMIAEMLIPLSGDSHDPFFDLAARRWVQILLLYLTLSVGRPTLPLLYRLITTIDGNREKFKEILKHMCACGNPEVARTGQAIANQQTNAGKTYAGVIETIMNALGFLGDPRMVEALSEPNFSLSELTLSDRPVIIYLCVPAELLKVWRSFVRVVIGVSMIHAQRSIGTPGRRRPWFLTDEAAQLGHAEFLINAYSYGRSFYDTLTAWQSLGQIKRHYKEAGMTEFLSSSTLLTVEGGGVNDVESAEYLSRYLGNMTVHYDDAARQRDQRHQMRRAIWESLLYDGDPVQAMADVMHHRAQAAHQERQSRALLTASELLRLPKSKRLALMAGVPPMLLDKLPYWQDRNMRGRYAPNPYHTPETAVR